MLLTRLFSLSLALVPCFALPDASVLSRDVVDLAPRQSNGTTGDSTCTPQMCITAVKNGTTVQYTLKSTGTSKLGWMAMGFGSMMINTPMVIMWANPNGTITLSQRKAPGFQMPTLDSNPPRLATLSQSLSITSGSQPSFVYTIPANSDTTQSLIWAFCQTAPTSSAEDADISQHNFMGTTQLDLSKAISGGSSGSGSTSGSGSGSSGSGSSSSGTASDMPFLPYQRMIIAHAVFIATGFLIFLPAGALLARYLRTFWPGWFASHWVAQFALGAPAIIVGFALGIKAVSTAGAPHFDDDHKKWGLALVVLYLVQCSLGAFIHWVKPRKNTGRPPQNYLHAVLGLLIIALAFAQVRNGYKEEWDKTTGRGDAPDAVNIVWYIWVVLLPVLYIAGLALLRRQYRLERESRMAKPMPNEGEDYMLNQRSPMGEYHDDPR